MASIYLLPPPQPGVSLLHAASPAAGRSWRVLGLGVLGACSVGGLVWALVAARQDDRVRKPNLGASANVDVDAVGTKFLALLPPEKRVRAERALAVILPAYAAGAIYNADYTDAKNTLNRLVDDAYEAHIQKPFLWGKGYTEVSKVDADMGPVMGLHNVISLAKKVAKLKQPSAHDYPDASTAATVAAYGDAQRAFVEGALPLALIVADLKSKIVKGRKPDPAAAARRAEVEARKNVQTCSVCFRGIAVLANGRIADHGYTLPQRWHKTASCPGSMFRPLEVASDGLSFMVKQLSAQAATLAKLIVQAPQLPRLSEMQGPAWKREQRIITPDDPEWARALARHLNVLERDRRETQAALVDYQQRLNSWRPGPQ